MDLRDERETSCWRDLISIQTSVEFKPGNGQEDVHSAEGGVSKEKPFKEGESIYEVSGSATIVGQPHLR
jgi:hypothetical protein